MIKEIEAKEWAERNFGKAEVSDVRRKRRIVKIATSLAKEPGKSIPGLFTTTYDVKAAYQLFKHEKVTPDNVQKGHREIVKEEINKEGVYLLIEDTSELSWSGKKPIKGLGPVAEGNIEQQGFHLHSVLAVKWEAKKQEGETKRPAVKVIGLCDQQYYIRKPRPAGENKYDSKARKYRERESQLWEKASYRIEEKPNNKQIKWIRVADRGADIYEMLESCQTLGHSYVIRAKDRVLLNRESGKKQGSLFEYLKQEEAIGEFNLELRARTREQARTAKLCVSVMPALLRSPQRPGHKKGTLTPIRCSAVRVWEKNPPIGAEPLEWILLCGEEVNRFEQALECALQYSARWLIEEFHKALKTGLGAERLQLETAQGLFSAISIMSIVALHLIDLRESLRLHQDSLAEKSSLSEIELKVLRLTSPNPIIFIKDVALAIGRLGGHLNRNSDGLPGWISLWRGMNKLRNLVEGFLLGFYSSFG